jgi:hypothetical protein
MRALVETVDGVFDLDLDEEEVIDFEPGGSRPSAVPIDLALPGILAADAYGSTIVAVVERRPPLVVSYDAGVTWTETGGGLPAGRAVAIAEGNPDLVLFAARNRLYLSRDGGTFWASLPFEVPEIRAVALMEA